MKRNKKIVKVFCSGCFDILHSGHIVFFNQCRKYGNYLIVSIGADKTIIALKGRKPYLPEENRLYFISALKGVDLAVLGNGAKDKMDFIDNLKRYKPDVFVLNRDDSAVKKKRELCDRLGIKLRLVPRIVPKGLKITSSTKLWKLMRKR